MPAQGFYISPHNPNAEQGGGDLVTPTHQTVDVRGPWVVFPAVDVAEAQGDVPLPHATLPLSIVKQIVVEAGGVVADDTGGEGDIRDKIARPAAETIDWEDIPVEDQNALQTQFPKGGHTRTQYGVTIVPASGAMAVTRSFEPPALSTGGRLPLDTPDGEGGYTPVDEETPAI